MTLSWRLILVVGILGLLVVLFWRETQWVRQSPPTSWTVDPQADCAVVLTGGPGRVRAGVDLLYRGAVKKLIVSGVFPGATLREIMPQLPFYGGLDEQNIILERRSTTTYGNAVQSQTLIEAIKCRSVVLVTSTLHMYRALRTFRGVIPEEVSLVPYAVVSGSLKPEWYDLWLESVKSLFYSVWAY